MNIANVDENVESKRSVKCQLRQDLCYFRFSRVTSSYQIFQNRWKFEQNFRISYPSNVIVKHYKLILLFIECTRYEYFIWMHRMRKKLLICQQNIYNISRRFNILVEKQNLLKLWSKISCNNLSAMETHIFCPL